MLKEVRRVFCSTLSVLISRFELLMEKGAPSTDFCVNVGLNPVDVFSLVNSRLLSENLIPLVD